MKRQVMGVRRRQVELPLWSGPTSKVAVVEELPPGTDGEVRAALADMLCAAAVAAGGNPVVEGGRDDRREDHG